jgi:hypothetical protein
MPVLATLEALRDQVRDELVKDPRYLTYLALERSIRDIRAAIHGADPSANLAVGPIAAVTICHVDAARPNGNAHGSGDVTRRAGDIHHGGTPTLIGAVQHRAERSAAWVDGPPRRGASANGGEGPGARQPAIQVDSEAMANLQHALIDLINGDSRGGKGRPAGSGRKHMADAAE